MSTLSNFLGRKVFLALMSLLTVFAVGCGSSSNDFILTGGGGETVFTTGTLSYLLRVDNITSLPNGTRLVRFDLYDDDGNLVLSTEASVADSIVIDEVTGDVKSTVVTVSDDDGFPIGQVTVPTEVVLGQNTTIDLSNVVFTPITFDQLTASPNPLELGSNDTAQLALEALFSNGASAILPPSSFAQNAAFVSNDTNVVTVDPTGLANGQSAGNTTVSATYTINGVDRSDIVTASVTNLDVKVNFVNALISVPNDFDDWSVEIGGDRQPVYIARLTLPDGQIDTLNVSELSFGFEPSVSGFSVSTSGEVSVSSNVTADTTANLIVSYTDGNGNTFSDVMVITAISDD